MGRHKKKASAHKALWDESESDEAEGMPTLHVNKQYARDFEQRMAERALARAPMPPRPVPA